MKKSDVQTKPLTERQIFSIKRDNLERKIISYFEHSQNVSAVIEYAVAIMVRNTLILSDYSFMFQDLICELLLTAKPSNTLPDTAIILKTTLAMGMTGKKSSIACLRIKRNFSILPKKLVYIVDF